MFTLSFFNILSLLITLSTGSRHFCSDPLVRKSQVVDLKYTTTSRYNSNTSSVELYLNISWNLNKPPNVELDGFIFFIKSASPRGFSFKSMKPTNVCNLGSSHYWVNTTDTNCSKEMSLCDGTPFQTQPNQQICSYNYTSGEAPCPTTGNRYIKGRGFLSIPINLRHLSFKIDFRNDYSFTIYPYFRQFIGKQKRLFVKKVTDCPTALSTSTNSSLRDATEKCCEQNIPHFHARNVTFNKPTVRYGENTVNVTVTWLPPINSEDLLGFTVFLVSHSGQIIPYPMVVEKTKILLSQEQKRNLADCDNTTHLYTAILSNLKANDTYEVSVNTQYSEDRMFDNECYDGHCETEDILTIPTINACDERYGICDQAARCIPQDKTGVKSLKVTCSCPKGHLGNGWNSKAYSFGTDCFDKSFCGSQQDVCVRDSVCVHKTSPREKGAHCACSYGFYGDGSISCYSISTVVLSISFPIFIFSALLMGSIARRYRHYSHQKTVSPKLAICFKNSAQASPEKKVDYYVHFTNFV